MHFLTVSRPFSFGLSPKLHDKQITDEFETLNVGGVVIKRLRHAKYIGTYLHDKLNWKAHLHYLCQKTKQKYMWLQIDKKQTI